MFNNQIAVLTLNQDFYERCILEIPCEFRKFLISPESLEENFSVLQNSTAILSDQSLLMEELDLRKIFIINSQNQQEKFDQFRNFLINQQNINQLFYKKSDFFPVKYENPQMKYFLQQLECVCHCDEDVLLEGETGCGKSWTARYIHHHSPRKNNKFLPVNVGSISENLFESEFFGNVPGAFTGARNKNGFFAQSNGGNLFIDEVSYFPLNLQPKLLTALENKKYMPVGACDEVEFDSRIIYATSKNLEHQAETGKFCRELLYRINSIKLEIPPLRHHLEDLENLCRNFAVKYKKSISSGALKKLYHYDFPGNIRELHNILRRACVFCSGSEIFEQDIVI